MSRLAALLMAMALVFRIDPTPAQAETSDLGRVPRQVRLVTGDEEAARLVDWAVDRFEAAGLALPPVDLRVHDSREGCEGHLGLTYDTPARASVHLCTPADGRGVIDRITLVHELAHAWVTENVGPRQREQFLVVHGLTRWEGADGDWARLGVEWAAETIGWAVSDDGVGMINEIHDDPITARRGYGILTHRTPAGNRDGRSVVARADRLDPDRAYRRTSLGPEQGGEPTTLDELALSWQRAQSRQGLPAGLPDWVRRSGSVVVTAHVTDSVELVVVTDGTGGVLAVTLNGGRDGVYELVDTVAAWGLLLETLLPDRTREIRAGRYDDALVDHDGRLRGVVHLSSSSG